MTTYPPDAPLYEPGDRVLIRPLGVQGVIVRKAAAPGFWVVQSGNGGRPVSWLWRELEKLP